MFKIQATNLEALILLVQALLNEHNIKQPIDFLRYFYFGIIKFRDI